MNTSNMPALPAIPALPARTDADERFALIELDRPTAAPVPSAEDTCTPDALIAYVRSIDSFGALRECAADFSSGKSLRAIYFRSLAPDVMDTVRVAWRTRRNEVISEVWSALWAPVAQAISTPTRAPETIEASLLAIRSEIPAPTTNAPVRRTARIETAAVRNAIRERTAVVTSLATALSSGHGARVTWDRASGKGLIKRSDLVACLESLGLADLAPPSPSATRQLGEAIKALKFQGLVAKPAPKTARQGNKGLWVIGTVDLRLENPSLGEKDLVIALRADDTLALTGSASLATRVRAEYERRLAGETYSATAALDWLVGRLRTRYHVASVRGGLYVPAGLVASVRALVDGVASVIGRDIGLEGLADVRDIAGSIARGLAGEAETLVERFATATDQARAEHREGIGARAAVTLLSEIADVRGRVLGYRTVIGDMADPVLATLDTLDTKARERLDDPALRAALIELE